jgi:hypothetical protein
VQHLLGSQRGRCLQETRFEQVSFDTTSQRRLPPPE